MRCGRQGLQHRNVICRDADGQPSGSCGLADKPPSSQPCTGPGYGDAGCREPDAGDGPGDDDRWKKGTDAAAAGGWRRLDGGPGQEEAARQRMRAAVDGERRAAAAPPRAPQRLRAKQNSIPTTEAR